MSEEKVLLVNKENGVVTITLNRTDKLNAFNDDLSFALQDALKDCEKDSAVKVIIITGSGRGFCSGQDLQDRMSIDPSDGNESQQGGSDRDGSSTKCLGYSLKSLGESIRKRYNPIILKIRTMEKPIIASVNGVAAGAGASLAFACDFRIASANASFIQSFTKVGLVPDSGSTFVLPRLIGLTKAFELMLMAEKLSAQDALNLGLVNLVVDAEKLAEQTMDWAKILAAGPTLAFALTKRAVNKAIFSDLEELLDYEASLQEIAGRSEDFAEGVKAFIQKRAPLYRGK